MLEGWIGRDKFRDGCRVSFKICLHSFSQFYYIYRCIINISCASNSNPYYFQQKYLKDFPFQNAKTSDFWNAQSEVVFLMKRMEKWNIGLLGVCSDFLTFVTFHSIFLITWIWIILGKWDACGRGHGHMDQTDGLPSVESHYYKYTG